MAPEIGSTVAITLHTQVSGDTWREYNADVVWDEAWESIIAKGRGFHPNRYYTIA